MFEDDADNESFEETVRSIAQELGRSLERAMGSVDLDEVAGAIGVDPDLAKEWIDSAGNWVRAQAERLGDEVTIRAAQPSFTGAPEDPLRSAGPHPLDLPSEEQGVALAALDSGRWMVEPGTEALAAKRDGPGPSDALGIVRELHARDWITVDGEITLVGRHALSRWLDAATLH
jgi:hypothetical protein